MVSRRRPAASAASVLPASIKAPILRPVGSISSSPVRNVEANPARPTITQSCVHIPPNVAVIAPSTTVSSDAGMNQVLPSWFIMSRMPNSVVGCAARDASMLATSSVSPPPTQAMAHSTCSSLKIE